LFYDFLSDKFAGERKRSLKK